jgi:hypothetical protein
MRRFAVAVAAIAAFGFARLPFERHLTKGYHEAGFHRATLDISLHQKIGQESFAAALSGLRAAVADYLWIKAHDLWMDTEWGAMKVHLDAVTSLQPRSLLFWDQSAWHMAWNASVAALQNPNQPREALRVKASREYIRIGEDYLLRGAQFNPDSAQLYDRLGQLYKYRMEDHCRASWAWFEAAKRPDAMGYVRRFAVYELAACPGHEREAYDLLVGLYKEGKHERLPTLLRLIDQLADKLRIPPEQRIDTSADRKEATPR